MDDELIFCDVCGDEISWDYWMSDGNICESCIDEDDDDDIPVGCLACGGPYPACKSSCPMFDD